MESDPLPRPSPDVIFRELEGEIVLVHLETNRIFALNSTGARFWELLNAGFDRAEIERRLTEEFEVGRPEVVKEVNRLLAELAAEELIA
jgi:Coenzyme PQQ synthesis protein D (PqqD)